MPAPAKPSPPAVLVTGAAGALAQRVIERLHRQQPVVAVDFRRRPNVPTGVPAYQVSAQGRSLGEIFRRHRIQSVLHLGRFFAHEQSRQARFRANVIGTKQLLELADRHGVEQVLVYSTYLVYGAFAEITQPHGEEDPLRGGECAPDLLDAVELEHLVHTWRERGRFGLTVLRPCNVLGVEVRNTLSQILSRRLVPQLLDYSPAMQCLHVQDMAEAVLRAHTRPQPGVYNVAPPEERIDYGTLLRRCGCRPVPVPAWPPAVPTLLSRLSPTASWLPAFLLDYMRYPVLLDGRRFAARFGWQPQQRLSDIVRGYRQAKGMA